MPDIDLSRVQMALLLVLWAIAIVASQVHWFFINKATRSRLSTGVGGRSFYWFFGLWHIGMLRRSWYPIDGRQYYGRIIASYAVGASAMLAAFVLFVLWSWHR